MPLEKYNPFRHYHDIKPFIEGDYDQIYQAEYEIRLKPKEEKWFTKPSLKESILTFEEDGFLEEAYLFFWIVGKPYVPQSHALMRLNGLEILRVFQHRDKDKEENSVWDRRDKRIYFNKESVLDVDLGMNGEPNTWSQMIVVWTVRFNHPPFKAEKYKDHERYAIK